MSDFGTDGNFDTTRNRAIERGAFDGAFDGVRLGRPNKLAAVLTNTVRSPIGSTTT